MEDPTFHILPSYLVDPCCFDVTRTLSNNVCVCALQLQAYKTLKRCIVVLFAAQISACWVMLIGEQILCRTIRHRHPIGSNMLYTIPMIHAAAQS